MSRSAPASSADNHEFVIAATAAAPAAQGRAEIAGLNDDPVIFSEFKPRRQRALATSSSERLCVGLVSFRLSARLSVPSIGSRGVIIQLVDRYLPVPDSSSQRLTLRADGRGSTDLSIM